MFGWKQTAVPKKRHLFLKRFIFVPNKYDGLFVNAFVSSFCFTLNLRNCNMKNSTAKSSFFIIIKVVLFLCCSEVRQAMATKMKRKKSQHSKRENYYWRVPEEHKIDTMHTQNTHNIHKHQQQPSHPVHVRMNVKYIIEMHLTINILMWCANANANQPTNQPDSLMAG